MSYTLFTGCSYTAGSGFDTEKDDPQLWVNQIHNRYFAHTKLLNVGSGGRSNAGIFQDTMWYMLHRPVRYAFVEWTSMPRYNLELGFELYETYQTFLPNGTCLDHKLNDIEYSSSYLNSIRDRFTALAHDCYEIVNLLHYVNVIAKCASLTQTEIFFVNGLCPWDHNFFEKKTQVLPNQYTAYTQKILNTQNRDDDEIFALYEKMHQRFELTGGIQSNLWLNLYDSMWDTRIDANNDGCHPGYESNKQYTQVFGACIESRLC